MKRKKVFSAISFAAFLVLSTIAVMILPCILVIGSNPDNIAECIMWSGIAFLACILLVGLIHRSALSVVSMDSSGISNGRCRIRWEDIGQVTTAEEAFWIYSPLTVRFTFICICRDALQPIERKTLKGKVVAAIFMPTYEMEVYQRCGKDAILLSMNRKNLKALAKCSEGKSKLLDEYITLFTSRDRSENTDPHVM